MEAFRSAMSTARRAGLLEPGLVAATMVSFAWWGRSTATAYAAAAARRPFRTAIVDDEGTLTYLALHDRTDHVAGALKHLGLGSGDAIGIMCRNHRGFVEANIAAAKIGARVVYLNTGLPAEQLQVVVERESVDAIVHDVEFTDVVGASGALRLIESAPELDPSWSFPTLPRNRRLWRPLGPRGGADPVILTSGTTGAPKGARRPADGGDAAAAMGLLSAIPYHTGDTMVVAAPLFHAWGLSQHLVAAAFHDTVVLRRRFDPVAILELTHRHEADILVVVPAMLGRMLESDSSLTLRHLRVTATSGAPLTGDLATVWMDRHGDNLYNMYGSTEVGQATIAGPRDLREAPGTAGRPPAGVELKVIGPDDRELPPGEIGEIVVASSFNFDGYTGGDTKPRRAGGMVTGDTGYLDDRGRLFVTGRADDMIISGGENLYPQGIEDVLSTFPGVREVAVVGVADHDLGQRVRAVVASDGAVDERALRDHAKAHLANYEVPREWIFVDELPRNATGKILRRPLVEL